ncbi:MULTISPECIES: YcgL domain-containing protein [unclassified Alcanivorax]|jgi:uncharacterized protein YcgL (UPF0745 family)|uniref:YcgL domain-containing protein n=1 Tax=unclassified Alcanivorax TaxID=2638842 RepID=UPI000789E021|nr:MULTISPECIES: YcgL domain-containing protein [unclassified Alcanivorax]KZX75332.1 hypothetical protein A3716_10900 [Alcanivorax sp. HI0011]KZX79930.1 hypothetical protein A3717_09150 [Alcanivorax sp. HI0013]KZY14497.1 hypothetical protein A3725_10775 [Alcanivorax sp. HI0035]MEE2604407.1 YcgL domain-containing protein [Pseudomonadota bacterium]KZX65864.1 hypothetical protein A3713_00405 [Alcanivorax sp. HI0003]|tara:strand:+ start:60 stop:365 length:306 start_codon:yes stop_codon:yes gene_type:complete
MLKGKLFCSIYKTRKKAGMYLFVDRQKGLKDLPEVLLKQFGTPIHVNDMILSPDRPLARADVAQVMEKIRDQGFYLQMPPPPDEDMFMADGHPDKPAGPDA